MASKGYFIITDISGYTEYLTKSDLERAHATLDNPTVGWVNKSIAMLTDLEH